MNEEMTIGMGDLMIHVLNYFNNRSTNVFAESFNAKIKRLRATFRGVTNIKYPPLQSI